MNGSVQADEPSALDKPAPARMSLDRISTVMGFFGLAFLALVLAVSAWNERRTLLTEAQDHAADTAFFLADHAARLFEVSDIALQTSTRDLGDLDWPAIATSAPLWESLQQTNQLMPYVGDLWLFDETGRLRMTTFAFPAPPTTVSDRAVFDAVRADEKLVIGERIVGQLTHEPTFLIARRINAADGTFRGMIAATVALSYFTGYWHNLELPRGERIAAIRGGTGDVLVATGRWATAPAVQNVSAFQHATADMPEAGLYNPEPKFETAFHRVGILPLYLTVSFSRADVNAAWGRWLLHLVPLALAAGLALIGIMVLGHRQGRREAESARAIAAARAQLQVANRSLEDRVAARTADLQDSNEQIQRYAYIISHDLRSPLVNIAGFTSELEELRPALFSGDGPDEETRRDFDEAIGFIQSSARKMDRLINAILTLSREGRRTFRPELIDLTPLLRSIVNDVAHRAHKAEAAVAIDPLPPLVSDRTAVEQIFANLIDNAVKYLRPGVPGYIQVSGERNGARVIITVEDNGRGIDARDHERVFDLFRRAGPQDQPGEGIGLTHVRAQVRRLGGTITLDSVAGLGSVFTVALPDMTESAQAESAA